MATAAAQRILDNLTTAVLTFDSALRLTAINPAGEMLFEVSAKKIIGLPLTDLLPKGRALARALSHTLTTRRPLTTRGLRLELPGDRQLTLDCTITPLVDGAEPTAPPETAAILLVELRQIDRLLRLAREEDLLNRQAANRAVMRGLAHEIKNPLGGLRGAAQLLERELPGNGLKEYTRVIIQEADRLRSLVDRMVSPSPAGKKRAINIHEVLEHVRLLILAEVPTGLSLRRDYDPSLPDVYGDADQLIQAVLNIVRNSVQALNGRGLIKLRTRVERGFNIAGRRHRLVLRAEVEDDGPGIPPALMEQIFYPLVTGRSDGTGLGLSIAQDIVTRHGGLIECSSQPGCTTFVLYLPLENGNG